MYIKPYNYQTKENNISYPEIANILVKIFVDKPANEEIPTPLHYLEPQKPR